jgi:hypothetical protein
LESVGSREKASAVGGKGTGATVGGVDKQAARQVLHVACDRLFASEVTDYVQKEALGQTVLIQRV